MDFDFYRNFIIVSRLGNITKASQKLNITQPALSAQIKKLEKHYGVSLINTHRGKQEFNLTAAGNNFRKKAIQICSLENELCAEMFKIKASISSRLDFGVSKPHNPNYIANVDVPFPEEIERKLVKGPRSMFKQASYWNKKRDLYPAEKNFFNLL